VAVELQRGVAERAVDGQQAPAQFGVGACGDPQLDGRGRQRPRVRLPQLVDADLDAFRARRQLRRGVQDLCGQAREQVLERARHQLGLGREVVLLRTA
jgi:hypothetical protein